MADVILSSIFDKGSQYRVPYTMVLSFFTGLCFNCQLRGEENYYRLSLYEAIKRTLDEKIIVKSANCPNPLKMSI